MSELKLEVGKTYMTRHGELVTIVKKLAAPGLVYPFADALHRVWMENGRYFNREKHERDLVEEVEPDSAEAEDPDSEQVDRVYKEDVEAVWSVFSRSVRASEMTVKEIIAARKEVLEAFKDE